MTIPTGPFPAAIDFADIAVGMHVQCVGVYPAPNSQTLTVIADGTVETVDQVTTTGTLTSGLPISAAASWAGISAATTNYLMEAFTGDPTEPAVGVVVKSADGTVLQRQDGSDPAVSVWYAPNSTTPQTWAQITSQGIPMQLGGN